MEHRGIVQWKVRFWGRIVNLCQIRILCCCYWVFYPPPLSKTKYMYLFRALLAKEELKNDQPEYSMYLALSIKMC